MKSSSVLIVGCGDLGIRAGTTLLDQGWQVHGVRRASEKLPEGFQGYNADYTRPESLRFIEQLQPEFVVAIFNPFDRSVAGYKAGFEGGMRNLLEGLGQHRPRHIFMTSSTRVFAETEGDWVDESGDLSTEDPWAVAIIAAERKLLASGYPASVVRFAGIYGIPGGRLLSRVRRGELCPASPLRYTNRIHREDAGGFLAHLLRRGNAGGALVPVYIGVDDLPVPRYEVESWLAEKMGVDDPMRELSQSLAEPTRHNTAGHRRCHNRQLTDSGYQLRYPDYRSGYLDLLDLT